MHVRIIIPTLNEETLLPTECYENFEDVKR